MRGHADALTAALRSQGDQCSTRWWQRTPGWGLRRLHGEARDWLSTLPEAVAEHGPDVLLWHYSAFSYTYRGVPTITPWFARVLSTTGVPVVTILHEFAYPWRYRGRGWRGATWTLTQRGVLPLVVGCSVGLIVTVEQRREWLLGRWWLPSRPAAVVPVSSTLPGAEVSDDDGAPCVCVFGYAESDAELVTDAWARVRDAVDRDLVLLGAPGRSSRAGSRWQRAAVRAGCAESLSFTGILPAQDLAAALQQCELMVFAEPRGPSPRRTTLAASLAAGRAVVAVDGPQTWDRLRAERAVLLTDPDAGSLAAALRRLLDDEGERAALSSRARRFYEQHQSIEVTAGRLHGFLDQVVGTAV